MKLLTKEPRLRRIRAELVEIAEATRVHEREVSLAIDKRPADLEDVLEGLAISATKLEIIIKDLETL